MARAKPKTRRGSPEAIAKRRAARSLNRLFDRGAATSALDGRTLKRKKRLLKELQEGKRGEVLKAHEVLSHVTELLGLGENMTSIRQLKPRLPPTPPMTEDMLSVIRDTQTSYGFDPRAWKLIGVDIDDIMAGGTGESPASTGRKKRGRKKKTA